MYKKLQDGENSQRLKQDYMDVFEGIKSGVTYTAKHDENSDIGKTYLGTSKMRRQDELKAEHKALITKDCYIHGKLLDGADCKIVLNTVVSKSFMSKIFYLNCPSLHSSPKFLSRTKNILVGDVQYVELLFVMPVLINLHGHRFEVYIHRSQRFLIMWMW